MLGMGEIECHSQLKREDKETKSESVWVCGEGREPFHCHDGERPLSESPTSGCSGCVYRRAVGHCVTTDQWHSAVLVLCVCVCVSIERRTQGRGSDCGAACWALTCSLRSGLWVVAEPRRR